MTPCTKCIKTPNGKFWYKNDKLHRLHRENGPAIEYADGNKLWYKNGLLHRIDGPAIEYNNGDKEWYKNGKLHRLDAPAKEYNNGSKYWYKNGEYHRLDGPAVECADGTKIWYKDGKLHREDGPACEYPNGHKEWFLDGTGYTEQEFNKKKNFIDKLEKIKIGRFGFNKSTIFINDEPNNTITVYDTNNRLDDFDEQLTFSAEELVNFCEEIIKISKQ